MTTIYIDQVKLIGLVPKQQKPFQVNVIPNGPTYIANGYVMVCIDPVRYPNSYLIKKICVLAAKWRRAETELR